MLDGEGVLIYLGFSALAVLVCAAALLLLGEPSILASTHLVLATAILPLIFGAITHFVPVLTRSSGAPRAVLLAPLALQVAGFLAFLHFFGMADSRALHASAGIALLVSLGFTGWLVTRARHTLGKPHPGWRWYLAAISSLLIALVLVPAMGFWPALRLELRLIHLHLNSLGFIGLTAIGTLQVLLPTVLSGPDAEAAARLRRDLPLVTGAVLAVALGAALWLPLALFGAAMLLLIGLRLGVAWWSRYGVRMIASDGVAVALTAALAGFLLLVVLGVAHAFRIVDGQQAIPAFVAAFLMPLVTGALSQLLPVWFYPGRRTPPRDRMRAMLVVGGRLRSCLFITGGLMLALSHDEGIWLAAAGLLSFILVIARSLVPRTKR